MIENFEKLTFHRKIDVLVAMHVMGWKEIRIEEKEWEMGGGQKYWACYGISPGIELTNDIPLYSVLLTSAWDIVRKFDYINLFRSTDFKGGQWECKLFDKRGVIKMGEPNYYGWAETEMLAICYAGLKAVKMGEYLKLFLQEESK